MTDLIRLIWKIEYLQSNMHDGNWNFHRFYCEVHLQEVEQFTVKRHCVHQIFNDEALSCKATTKQLLIHILCISL